jgi:hypothetical protein
VLDTEKFRFIIYIWYEGGELMPSLVKLDCEGERSPSALAGGTHKATSADIG